MGVDSFEEFQKLRKIPEKLVQGGGRKKGKPSKGTKSAPPASPQAFVSSPFLPRMESLNRLRAGKKRSTGLRLKKR